MVISTRGIYREIKVHEARDIHMGHETIVHTRNYIRFSEDARFIMSRRVDDQFYSKALDWLSLSMIKPELFSDGIMVSIGTFCIDSKINTHNLKLCYDSFKVPKQLVWTVSTDGTLVDQDGSNYEFIPDHENYIS